MLIANVVFPGTNRDEEALESLTKVLSPARVDRVGYDSSDLLKYDLIFLAGGFSYGDYLRCGAQAARTKVIESLRLAAKRGAVIIGVCNGFQILCEAHLLEGALLVNRLGNYICTLTDLSLDKASWLYKTSDGFEGLRGGSNQGQANPANQTNQSEKEKVTLRLPIAHYEGRYWADEATLDRLEQEGRVLLRYEALKDSRHANGSARRIACVTSASRRIIGMMPHPENAVDSPVAGNDGEWLLRSLYEGALAS